MAVSAWGGTATSSLNNILGQATYNADAAVRAAQGGVGAVLSGQGVVNSAVAGMNANAQKMNQQADAAIAQANSAKATYDQLGPLAALFGVKASDLWSEGQGLSQTAGTLFGQAGGLLGMDRSAGGIAGEFLRMYDLLSPDRYVAQAASDTQGAFQNSLAQSERNLSRKGVSAGSGASLALQNQFSRLLATAVAAAKTKARQTGIDQQSAYLDKMLSAANTLYGTANQTEQNALTAKNASLTAQSSQGSTIGAQAQGYVTVGGLQIDAGKLFGSAAETMGNAASVNTSYLNALNTAYGNLASANANAAATKRNAAALEATVNTGIPATGGWTVSKSGSSSGDDFMNWKGTGHSETYMKNHQYGTWKQLTGN